MSDYMQWLLEISDKTKAQPMLSRLRFCGRIIQLIVKTAIPCRHINEKRPVDRRHIVSPIIF